MGAFWEIFFLLVTIVSPNTLLIHYYTKNLQNSHFVSQISPQEQYLEKNRVYNNVANGRCYEIETKRKFGNAFWGRKLPHNMAVLGIFYKISQKRPFCATIYTIQDASTNIVLFPSCSNFHWLRCGILHFFCRCFS